MKFRSTKVDAGDFKHELLSRLRSTMAVNVLSTVPAGLNSGPVNGRQPVGYVECPGSRIMYLQALQLICKTFLMTYMYRYKLNSVFHPVTL